MYCEDAKVKSADTLLETYFTSVGRNSKLLLNVPPTRAGLLHETDVAQLRGRGQIAGRVRGSYLDQRPHHRPNSSAA